MARDYWRSRGASTRLRNCLVNEGIKDVDQLAAFGARKLMSIQNIGKTSLNEARSILADFSLRFHDEGGAPPNNIGQRIRSLSASMQAAKKEDLLPVHVIMAAYLLREAGWTVTPPPTLQATSPALAPAPRRGA